MEKLYRRKQASLQSVTNTKARIYTHTHTLTHTHTHTYLHTRTHTYTHAYTHTYTCTHTYTHTHLHTHTHIYTHLYTYTRRWGYPTTAPRKTLPPTSRSSPNPFTSTEAAERAAIYSAGGGVRSSWDTRNRASSPRHRHLYSENRCVLWEGVFCVVCMYVCVCVCVYMYVCACVCARVWRAAERGLVSVCCGYRDCVHVDIQSTMGDQWAALPA